MITLTTVSTLQEADMLCSTLRAHGISTFIPDQNTVSIRPYIGNAIGGIRIQIDEKDLDRASQAIRQRASEADKARFECPNCKSKDITYERISKWVAFLCGLFLGIPLLWLKPKHKCNSCGYEWKEK